MLRYSFHGGISILLFCILTSFYTVAQDSTMNIKRFSYDDLTSEKFEKYKKRSSTNRLAENPDDLTQEVIVIDGEEIRKFGYSTLVDVLKTIPGFRTSQPGNATEGETFLMRGLLGNDYTKILINGIPIKPEAVKSMPIAAQLPIRHAEYIEIVQGPSSATYGSDAMAGVINIVFPEIDRPVFAWADVNGITPATSEINLTLGGKAGKGKNILNYEIFASSQRASDVNLLIPEDSLRVDTAGFNYEWAYYQPEKDDRTLAEVGRLKRESRIIGTYLKFRWFELSAMNMYREEHSSFGSSPLISGYHDAGTVQGENINSIGLKHIYSNKKNYSSRAALSVVNYRTLQNASLISTNDFLSNGINYIYGRSVDFRGEYQGIYEFNNAFKMAFGTTGQYGVSNPYTSTLGRRFNPESNSFEYQGPDLNPETPSGLFVAANQLSTIDSFLWIPKHVSYNIAGFAHFLYKSPSKKLNVEAAIRADYSNLDNIRFTPKIGAVYRPVPRIKLVANYSAGHRSPRSYHLYNNYWQNANELKNSMPNLLPGTDPRDYMRLRRSRDSLGTERLHGVEFRAEWKASDALTIKGRYYFHEMENRLFRQQEEPPLMMMLPSDARVGVGYFNNESKSELHAILITATLNKTIGDVSIRGLIGYEYATGHEEVDVEEDLNTNAPAGVVKSAEYRFVPEHNLKANLNVSYKGFTVSLYNNYFGHYVTEIYRVNASVRYEETDAYYYNLDILVHKDLFRQMSLFVGAYNVLNTVQSGIPGATVSSTWEFNPQYGRTFKFGLNFRLN